MINNLTTKTEVVAFTLTSAELEKFGLNEQDEQEIKAVAECINADDPEQFIVLAGQWGKHC